MTPAALQALYAQALRHHQAGQLGAAEAAYRQILAADPRHSDSLHLLGVIAHQLGRHDQSAALIRQAIALAGAAAPAPYHLNLGSALQGQGRLEEAAASLRRALVLKPDHVLALCNLGNVLIELGRFDQAIAQHQAALALNPDFAEGHYNLGNALKAAGRFDEAAGAYRAALGLNPRLPAAQNNLGIVLAEMGLWSQAAEAYRLALGLRPDHALAHSNLANALSQMGRLDEAADGYRAALRLAPEMIEATYNLGMALEQLGRREEAAHWFRRALALRPDHVHARLRLLHNLQHLCDWPQIAALEDQVLAGVRAGAEAITPFPLVALAATPADQLACARAYAATLAPPKGQVLARRPAHGGGRIRLGYLSCDYHAHATAYLIAELIERHDRTRFEVIGYSFGPDDRSAIRQRLIAGFDRFVELGGLSHRAAAQRIWDDQIDILIDLKGYTQDSRSQILAFRPAPIQVNYLGYPATMGADFIDHIIADAVCIPPGGEGSYSEQVVRLPGCYQPNDSQRQIATRTPSRADCGLPEQGFVYGCFNNSYKITAALFDVWMRLLRATTDAVLWLLESNASVRANLSREAAARGVDPQRLVFAPRRPLDQHLARHRLADLFLDTTPCNAHTTASEALWAGLPLLTCLGATFAGRVAASLLSALDLPELICADLAGYEAAALRLAANPDDLAELKARLARRRATTALFDGAAHARDLERALAQVHTDAGLRR